MRCFQRQTAIAAYPRQLAKAALVSTTRDGATTQLRLPRREIEDRGGLSCEIVQTYARMISHDWHVQPSCQRPNRNPPRRREFSPGENARKRIRLSSKLYNHTVRFISRQSLLPTEFPDDFHIGNPGRESCHQP